VRRGGKKYIFGYVFVGSCPDDLLHVIAWNEPTKILALLRNYYVLRLESVSLHGKA
jgi:hypothetical protein